MVSEKSFVRLTKGLFESSQPTPFRDWAWLCHWVLAPSQPRVTINHPCSHLWPKKGSGPAGSCAAGMSKIALFWEVYTTAYCFRLLSLLTYHLFKAQTLRVSLSIDFCRRCGCLPVCHAIQGSAEWQLCLSRLSSLPSAGCGLWDPWLPDSGYGRGFHLSVERFTYCFESAENNGSFVWAAPWYRSTPLAAIRGIPV